MPRAKVYVTLKEGILDAQGSTVKTALEHLGFGVDDVRIGKYIEMRLPAGVSDAEVKAMCDKLLANTVIEGYRVEVA